MDEVARLRGLHEAATSAPWHAEDDGEWVVRRHDGDFNFSFFVATFHMSASDETDGSGRGNAEFVAAMRNSLPALLDVAEAARAYHDTTFIEPEDEAEHWHFVLEALDRLEGGR